MLSVTVSSNMMFSTMLTQSYSCLVKFKSKKIEPSVQIMSLFICQDNNNIHVGIAFLKQLLNLSKMILTLKKHKCLYYFKKTFGFKPCCSMFLLIKYFFFCLQVQLTPSSSEGFRSCHVAEKVGRLHFCQLITAE